MLQDLIVAVVAAVAKSIDIGREAAAAEIEDTAKKIRSGALIPDAAFSQAQKDVDRFENFESED